MSTKAMTSGGVFLTAQFHRPGATWEYFADIGAAEAAYNRATRETSCIAAFLYDRDGKLLDHFYAGGPPEANVNAQKADKKD